MTTLFVIELGFWNLSFLLSEGKKNLDESEMLVTQIVNELIPASKVEYSKKQKEL